MGQIIAENNKVIKELRERINMDEKAKGNFIRDEGISKLIEENKDYKLSNEYLKNNLDIANEFKSAFESKNNELELKIKELQSNLEDKNKRVNEMKSRIQILESKLEMQIKRNIEDQQKHEKEINEINALIILKEQKNIESENVIKQFKKDIEVLRMNPWEEIDDERDLKTSQYDCVIDIQNFQDIATKG